MKKLVTVLVIILSVNIAFADSISINRKLETIESKVKQIESNQLNYKIEKDLLKETYSNNYQNLNMIITLILGIIGVLGFLGIKDITSTKKEYEKELAELKLIQNKFIIKTQEIENDKKKFDEDIKSILKENEEQSKKIKFIELKDKVNNLIESNNLSLALEFANAAIQINDNDLPLLNQKGRILCRLNQLSEAKKSFMKALELNPSDNSTILNTTECLYFGKEFEAANELINKNLSTFENKGKVMELFKLIQFYHLGDIDAMKKIARENVTVENLKSVNHKMSGWDLKESLYFAVYQPENNLRNVFQNILWYWDGQIDGETLLTRLEIELPKSE